MIKTCIICGKGFKCSPSDKTITCSKVCSAARKRHSHLGKSNIWGVEAKTKKSIQGLSDNLKKGTPAAQKSPIAGSFETNQEAKNWTLQAPWGEVFKIRNLRLFFKNNPEYIPDNTPDQACKGIYGVKSWYLGKRKDRVESWRDWKLLDWGE